MKKRNRCLVMVLVTALLLGTADTGLGMKKANAESKETTAYLEFIDGQWGSAYKSSSNGTDSKVIAEDAVVDGDGVYRLSLDFSERDGNCANGITNCIIRIEDGEELFGSKSLIQVRSVKIKNSDGKEEVLEGKDINAAYTFGDTKGQTSLYLYGPNHVYWEAANTCRAISGQETISQEDWEASGYQLLSEWSEASNKIQKIEVTFAFAESKEDLAEIPEDATPKPHSSGTPETSATPTPTATPEESATPTPTATPEITETPTETPEASSTPEVTEVPTETPEASATPEVTETPTPTTQSSVKPSETPNPSGNIISNSTYSGPEKIFVSKSAVVVAAGGHTSVTIALLRGATSNTEVTASTGNKDIAVPTLQPSGKLDIAVPAGAPAGRSTTITLRFGSSYATVTVTVSNPVTQLKGAKKSYKIKRKKTAKVSVKLTPKSTSYATTDTVTASISKKKVASVSSVKLSGNKVVVKVKALKKGSAKLKVKAGGKTASIKIKVK